MCLTSFRGDCGSVYKYILNIRTDMYSYHMLVAIVMILPSPSLSLVNCRTACERCRGRQDQYPGILEVYCSMCRECDSQRRQEIIEVRVPDDPDTCPTPPPCDETTEDLPSKTPLSLIVPATTSTRTPCPPVTGCIPKITVPPSTTPTFTFTTTTTPLNTGCNYPCVPPLCPYPCAAFCPYPCGPICPYPNPQCPSSTPEPLYQSVSELPRLVQSVASVATSRGRSDLYVYVGVPRDIVPKKLEQLSWD